MKFIQRIIDNLIEKYIVHEIQERVEDQVTINLSSYNFDIEKQSLHINDLEKDIAIHDTTLKAIYSHINILERELRAHIGLEENLAADSTSQLVVNLLEDSIKQIKNEGLSISEINRIVNTLTSYKNEKVNTSLNKKDNPISRVKLI